MSDPRTVLVVDDEPDVLLLCRLTLEAEGYRVIEATDGEAALARLVEEVPDVVVLDVTLPARDGRQVLEAVRADPRTRDVRVVLTAAPVQDEDPVQGWSSDAAEYVTKPFSPLCLVRILEDVLATDPGEEAERRQLVRDKLTSLHDPP